MVSVLDAAIAAVGGVIGVFIFVEIFQIFAGSGVNTNISSGAVSLLGLTDLILAAVIIVGIVAFGFSRR